MFGYRIKECFLSPINRVNSELHVRLSFSFSSCPERLGEEIGLTQRRDNSYTQAFSHLQWIIPKCTSITKGINQWKSRAPCRLLIPRMWLVGESWCSSLNSEWLCLNLPWESIFTRLLKSWRAGRLRPCSPCPRCPAVRLPCPRTTSSTPPLARSSTQPKGRHRPSEFV